MRTALATVAAVAALFATPSSPADTGSRRPGPQRPTVVVKVSRGFGWADALIGAAAASGVLLALAGGLRALRHEEEEKR